MAIEFKDYAINTLLAGLFLIALISFGITLAHNYGENEALMKSDKIDFSGLETRLNQTNADATSWGETFKSDNLFVVAGGIVLYSIWGISKLVWNSVISIFVIFTDGASSLIGIPPIAIGVLTAIIIIGLIFSLWRLIKTGQ